MLESFGKVIQDFYLLYMNKEVKKTFPLKLMIPFRTARKRLFGYGYIAPSRKNGRVKEMW